MKSTLGYTITSSVNLSLSSRLMTILWVRAWPDLVSCRLLDRALVWFVDEKLLQNVSDDWTWLEYCRGAAMHTSLESWVSGWAELKPVSVDSEFGLVAHELLATWLKASMRCCCCASIAVGCCFICCCFCSEVFWPKNWSHWLRRFFYGSWYFFTEILVTDFDTQK